MKKLKTTKEPDLVSGFKKVLRDQGYVNLTPGGHTIAKERTMKTLEQMAETFAQTIDACCGTSDIIIATENAFLAGYKAGVQEAETRILNEFFDNYGAVEHAKFACKVNAYEWDTDKKNENT